jgi:hypothetical protein
MIARAFGIRRLVCSLFASLFALSAARALDLTPQSGVRRGNEGPGTPTIEFSDGKARFSYVLPYNWRPSGGGNLLSFFTSEPSASVKLMVVGKDKSQSQPDAATPKEDLQAWAAKFLPGGANKVEFVKLVPGPFPMGPRSVNEFIFKFDASGTPSSASITVIDFNEKERLLMLVSAPAKSFEKIRGEAISTMSSLAVVE